MRLEFWGESESWYTWPVIPAISPEFSPEVRERLTSGCELTITSATAWHPDFGPVEARGPLNFVLHLGGGMMTYYSSTMRRFWPAPEPIRDRLLAAGSAAVADGSSCVGVDTAVGRFMTNVQVLLSDPLGCRRAGLGLNHYDCLHGVKSPGWIDLLRLAADVVGDELADTDLRQWLALLNVTPKATALPDSGFDSGLVAKVPDNSRLVRLPLEPALYLRVNQPPEPSCLLQLRRVPSATEILVLGGDGSKLIACLPDPVGDRRDYWKLPVPRWSNLDSMGPDTAPLRLSGALEFVLAFPDSLRRTFEIDTICPRCKSPLRLIALIKTDDTIKKILSAMGLPTEAPKPYPARPPPSESGGEGGDWLN